ncbi:MAG TPA: DUF885 domain-containing protein [Bryobacteraceae bacterium]|jgi:uncharacterized protein (DUF885 family)|nr:DUF885 domain-containing protein [Bryobacteraceae bacterium]
MLRLSFLFAALGCVSSIWASDTNFAALVEEQWQYRLRNDPEMATHAGDYRYNDKLSDRSAAAHLRDVDHARSMLKRFEAVDNTRLSAEDKITRALLIGDLRDTVEEGKFKPWEMPINQFDGFHLEFAELASDSPFRSVKEYQDYAKRLHALPVVFDQEIANMRAGMADHLMPPRFLLEKAAQQIQTIAGYDITNSPFVQPVLHFPGTIAQAQRGELKAAVIAAVKDDVTPAYRRLYEFVHTAYAPAGRADPGVWSLPDGQARYRFAVRRMTTTDLGPDEIHKMGLSLVAEIENAMLAIARKQGYADLKSFNAHIRSDRALYAKSGKQLLDLYQHYTDQMYTRLPQLFRELPRNKLAVVPMEQSRSADAVPADYSIGAGDGSRPGRINVNLYDPSHRLLLNVEAIAYHEGVPGHHLQFSIAQETKDLPPIRKFDLNYNAFSEGWAFYAERLGKEAGFYQDPYSDYGRLGNEMWRAVRLVVDTGVHYKHWTRQQMVDYFREHTAMDEPNIQTEVDRYIAWPAQALSYKAGQMKIVELREKAKRELGARFDIRDFHAAVLGHGALPLNILEQQVDEWIASVKSRS